ncbi:MAG: TRAP transporter substrate-binding protein DctP [Oceanospirillaceae bacterium]|nr:TRAP transporter substrate-binding protein DctP [Oceanospirillaceae bacterium]
MKLNKFKKNKLLATSAVVLSLLSAGYSNASENWIGYTYSAVSTTAAVKGLERIVQEVETNTDGDLEIKLNLGKSLQIKSSDITQAAGDDIVQFAADGFFLGNVPIGGVLRLPMLINSDEEWAKAVEVMKPFLKKGFEEQWVAYLGGYRYPQQVFFTTFEMKSLSDMEGKKIRVTSPEQGEFVKAFGGQPINLAGTEVPTSLERGVIDGVITASAGGAKNWSEFLHFNYRFGVNYFNSVIIANADRFNDLPEKSQKALADAVDKESAQITEDFSKDELIQKESQQEKGMVIYEANEADFNLAVEKMKPYWDEWASSRGPEYVEALSAVKEALGK